MKVIYLSLTIGLIIMTSHLFGQYQQTPITKSKQHISKYIYKGKIYSYSKLGHAFDNEPDFKNQYLASRKTFRTAAGFGWTSIASITVGGILLNTEPNPDSDQWIASEILAGLWLTVLVAPATGIAALIALLQYETRKNKLIQKFNDRVYDNEGSLSLARLKLGPTKYGFGITLNF